ncbi:MAG: heparan-alpha-glucosaminide N-acetyltransferase domain-containing protein [Bacillota bacterium]|nr:heparan-alpha-glucosaminide N-acetyltransferase domain-containing protein [Bacillota bacterium]
MHSLDEIRGFCVLCMVFFHAFFTIGYIFNWSIGNILYDFFAPIEPFFAGTFILISGFSCNLSHSNLIRGFKLLAVALIINIITIFITNKFDVDIAIYFGILNLLSICMILYGLLEKVKLKIPFKSGLFVTAILFLITYNISYGYIGFAGPLSVTLPSSLYQTNNFFMFGFFNDSFQSADYFPILPWVFLFFFGSCLGQVATNNKLSYSFYKLRFPPLSFLGRHALIIYILHQPVILGILYLISLFIH